MTKFLEKHKIVLFFPYVYAAIGFGIVPSSRVSGSYLKDVLILGTIMLFVMLPFLSSWVRERTK